jgi:hypothetical protein
MHPSNRSGGDPHEDARIYRQVKRGLPVQRRPPAQRPGRFTTCSALLSFSRSDLSTGTTIGYLPSFGGSAGAIDELVPGDAGDVDGLVDEGGGDEGDAGDEGDDFGVTIGGVLGAVDVFVSR